MRKAHSQSTDTDVTADKDLVGTTKVKVHIRAHECRVWFEKHQGLGRSEIMNRALHLGNRHKNEDPDLLLKLVATEIATPASHKRRTHIEIVFRSQYDFFGIKIIELRKVLEIGLYKLFLRRDSP